MTEIKAAARRSIEEKGGAPYTDAEWQEAKRNLAAFFGVLPDWGAENPKGSRDP